MITFFHGVLRSVALIQAHFIIKHNYFIFLLTKHENQAQSNKEQLPHNGYHTFIDLIE